MSAERQMAASSAAGQSTLPGEIRLLRDKAHMLSGPDAVLMKMFLEYGSSPAELARLAGITEQRMARRLSKMAARLIDGRYINCLQHRDKLTERELCAARDCFVGGLSARQIAAKWGWSYHQARSTLRKIQRVLGESL